MTDNTVSEPAKSEPALQEVVIRQRFSHPAAAVWTLTGDFGGLDKWLPGVVSCTVSGEGARDAGGNAQRSVQLMDGSVTRESLESLDEAAMCYGYAILEAKGFKPNQTFRAQFQVLPVDDGHCEVIWSASFSVPPQLAQDKIEGAREKVRQMYQFFLGHLASLL